MKRIRIEPVMPPARELKEDRNLEIVRLKRRGYTCREIAAMPGIHVSFQHVARIVQKYKPVSRR